MRRGEAVTARGRGHGPTGTSKAGVAQQPGRSRHAQVLPRSLGQSCNFRPSLSSSSRTKRGREMLTGPPFSVFFSGRDFDRSRSCTSLAAVCLFRSFSPASLYVSLFDPAHPSLRSFIRVSLFMSFSLASTSSFPSHDAQFAKFDSFDIISRNIYKLSYGPDLTSLKIIDFIG